MNGFCKDEGMLVDENSALARTRPDGMVYSTVRVRAPKLSKCCSWVRQQHEQLVVPQIRV